MGNSLKASSDQVADYRRRNRGNRTDGYSTITAAYLATLPVDLSPIVKRLSKEHGVRRAKAFARDRRSWEWTAGRLEWAAAESNAAGFVGVTSDILSGIKITIVIY